MVVTLVVYPRTTLFGKVQVGSPVGYWAVPPEELQGDATGGASTITSDFGGDAQSQRYAYNIEHLSQGIRGNAGAANGVINVILADPRVDAAPGAGGGRRIVLGGQTVTGNAFTGMQTILGPTLRRLVFRPDEAAFQIEFVSANLGVAAFHAGFAWGYLFDRSVLNLAGGPRIPS